MLIYGSWGTAMSDVAQWLEELGLNKYSDMFTKNSIGFDVLAHLTDEHLK